MSVESDWHLFCPKGLRPDGMSGMAAGSSEDGKTINL